MKVKFNGELSEFFALIGGGPQGTLLGQLEYLVQSNNNLDTVPPEDRFKYIDDLSLLQLVCLSGLLTDYNFYHHVASDQQYLPPESYPTQNTLNTVAKENLVEMNEAKCNYMVFSRSHSDFATRLNINNVFMERTSDVKLLGVWLSDDLSWSRNCKEMSIKAYSRLTMLTKLKYIGTSVEDLLDIYILYIRSVLEYCSVAFHSSLTDADIRKLEGVQKTCLRVILGEMYVGYEAALEMCGLESLSTRREIRCLSFSQKCVRHPKNKRLFPLNTRTFGQAQNTKETFLVNWARTDAYRNSAIPYCQRLLNQHYST